MIYIVYDNILNPICIINIIYIYRAHTVYITIILIKLVNWNKH